MNNWAIFFINGVWTKVDYLIGKYISDVLLMFYCRFDGATRNTEWRICNYFYKWYNHLVILILSSPTIINLIFLKAGSSVMNGSSAHPLLADFKIWPKANSTAMITKFSSCPKYLWAFVQITRKHHENYGVICLNNFLVSIIIITSYYIFVRVHCWC